MPRFVRLALPTLLAVLSACGDSPSEPSEQEIPNNPPPFQQIRGRLVATGVKQLSNGFWDPGWVFLGNEREIALGTGTGYVGQSALLVQDVDALSGNTILSGLNGPSNLLYASTEDRIYWGAWQEVLSVDLDGSNPDTLTTDNEGFIQVSPNGRYLLHRRASDRKTVLVDQQQGRTTEIDLELQLRLFDEYAVFPVFPVGGVTSLSGVGIQDLASGDTVLMTGLATGGPAEIIDLGGSRDAPRMIFIAGQHTSGRVDVFIGDSTTGTGTTRESFAIPGGILGDARGIPGSASRDGSRIAVSVGREIVSACTSGALVCWRWEILLLDVSTDAIRTVAQGISEHGPDGIVLSPGGTRLLYQTGGWLYLVDLP